jgi:preprotein translocase subunit SecB
MRHRSFLIALLSNLSFSPISAKPVDFAALKQQVIDTERAFCANHGQARLQGLLHISICRSRLFYT